MSAATSVGVDTPPATLGELVAWAAARITSSETPQLDAEVLLAKAAGVARSTILAFPERPVEASARRAFAALVEHRRDEVPIAYLLGEREFYSLPLEVGPGVLVPRPETELIVETALCLLDAAADVAVLDLGTGSGAIALAIKHARPSARVTGVDRSRAALAIARRNAARLALEVELLESDWFAEVGGRAFDVIVGNPPYVERAGLDRAPALRHEPRAALDGGPDGLDAIRAILGAAREHLVPGGYLLLEHGDRHGAATRSLASRQGLVAVRTLEDLAGRDRLLIARAA